MEHCDTLSRELVSTQQRLQELQAHYDDTQHDHTRTLLEMAGNHAESLDGVRAQHEEAMEFLRQEHADALTAMHAANAAREAHASVLERDIEQARALVRHMEAEVMESQRREEAVALALAQVKGTVLCVRVNTSPRIMLYCM
jgi:hypothetical protein